MKNTYEDFNSRLTGRCKDRRKLQNNTYLERYYDPDRIAVCLHSTDVLTFFPDGAIELDTGGWSTITTQDRMNTYLPDPWSVGRVSGTMVLYRHGNPLCLVDKTAIIDAQGNVSGGDYQAYADELREERNERQRVRSRALYWTRKARGLYVDRSNCTATYRWNCEIWRNRNGRLTPGVYACGCIVTHKQADPGKLTVQDIMAEENATVRLAKMTIYGLDRFMLDAGAKTIDSAAGYDLIELAFGGFNRVRAIKMVCSSTGAVYINMVPAHLNRVSKALDWMFQTENYLERIGQQA